MTLRFEREGRIGTAIRAAASASQQQVMATTLLIAVPILCMGGLFASLGLSALFVAPMVCTAVLLPVSVFVHEAAHALAAAVLTPRSRPFRLRGEGGWATSILIRESAGPANDAVIAWVGPVAGTLCYLPVLLTSTQVLFAAPWILTFTVHLFSLRRNHPDGKNLYDYLARRSPHAEG